MVAALEKWGTHHAVILDSDTTVQTIENEDFDVPSNVTVIDVGNSTGSLRVFTSGSDVQNAIENDASFSASYLGVSASGSVSQGTTSEYPQDRSFAFFTSSQHAYDATLNLDSSVVDYLNDDLLKDILALPTWDPLDDDAFKAYDKLFELWGHNGRSGRRAVSVTNR